MKKLEVLECKENKSRDGKTLEKDATDCGDCR